MDSKTSNGGLDPNGGAGSGRNSRPQCRRLERVLSFWGSYCYADVSDWSEDEINGFSDSIAAPRGSARQQQSAHRVHRAVGGYPNDD